MKTGMCKKNREMYQKLSDYLCFQLFMQPFQVLHYSRLDPRLQKPSKTYLCIKHAILVSVVTTSSVSNEYSSIILENHPSLRLMQIYNIGNQPEDHFEVEKM